MKAVCWSALVSHAELGLICRLAIAGTVYFGTLKMDRPCIYMLISLVKSYFLAKYCSFIFYRTKLPWERNKIYSFDNLNVKQESSTTAAKPLSSAELLC